MGEGTESVVHSRTAVRERGRDATAGKAGGESAEAGWAKRQAAIRARSAWKTLLRDIGAGLAIPAALLAVWQLAGSAGLISPAFMPTPAVILSSLLQLAGSGELAHHLGISLERAGLGFLIGGALGIALGLFAGISRTFGYLVDPSVQVLRLVPHLAIAPLIILWFGFGEVSKVAIIISGSFFPLYINTYTGIRGADGKLLEVGRTLDFGAYKKLKRIILPAALPNILLGVRLSLGAAWIGLVVAELIGSQSGVGFLINNAKQNADTKLIFAGIIIFAVAGKLIDSLVRLLERKLLKWRDHYRGS